MPTLRQQQPRYYPSRNLQQADPPNSIPPSNSLQPFFLPPSFSFLNLALPISSPLPSSSLPFSKSPSPPLPPANPPSRPPLGKNPFFPPPLRSTRPRPAAPPPQLRLPPSTSPPPTTSSPLTLTNFTPLPPSPSLPSPPPQFGVSSGVSSGSERSERANNPSHLPPFLVISAAWAVVLLSNSTTSRNRSLTFQRFFKAFRTCWRRMRRRGGLSWLSDRWGVEEHRVRRRHRG